MCGVEGEVPSSLSLGGDKGGCSLSEEREHPPLSGSGAQRRTIHAAPAALHPPHPPRRGESKGAASSKREYPPLSGSSAKSCTNSCSADGAATTHPPQGRLKRDTLFGKKVSLFIFPFPRSAEISVPAPVQVYFLKLSFSVTDRLNTRCSGVQSLLSRQK